MNSYGDKFSPSRSPTRQSPQKYFLRKPNAKGMQSAALYAKENEAKIQEYLAEKRDLEQALVDVRSGKKTKVGTID